MKENLQKENLHERKSSRYKIFLIENLHEKKSSQKKIYLKFKSLCPLPPSAKDELIGVSPALCHNK